MHTPVGRNFAAVAPPSRKCNARLGRRARENDLADTPLLRRVAARDLDAFSDLYRRYQRRLHRYLTKLLADADIAADLTDEVMFEIWISASKFKRSSLPCTWILGIARNKGNNELRKRREEQLDERQVNSLSDPSAGPDVAHEIRCVERLMRQTLERLPQAQREVVELIYYGEFSVRDAAALLRCPENTVKTRLFYARHHMRKLLLAAETCQHN